MWVLAGARIVELAGMTDPAGATALAVDEIAGLPETTEIALIAQAKRA